MGKVEMVALHACMQRGRIRGGPAWGLAGDGGGGGWWARRSLTCSAQMGSISATMTRAPAAFIAAEQPLPTSPYPAMKTTFPAIMTSVARMIPSGREWRHPYLQTGGGQKQIRSTGLRDQR